MPEPTETRTPPPMRSAFPLFVDVPTRWADNDAYGHMNNVVHYALFDTAVNRWLIENGVLDLKNGTSCFLVVETACRYHGEMAFPDRVTAGLRIERLGGSSVTYALALFRENEERAAADGRFVHVHVDRATRRPLPLDPAKRAALERLAA